MAFGTAMSLVLEDAEDAGDSQDGIVADGQEDYQTDYICKPRH